MTCTSGPGISLMAEFIGLGLLRRNPVRDHRRSTRRPVHRAAHAHACRATSSTTPSLSHGDTRHPVLFPSSPEECFTMAQAGLRSRGVLPDPGVHQYRPRPGHEQLDGRPVRISGSARSQRGKVLTAEDLDAARRLCPLQGRGRRRRSATARCPAPTTRRPAISRAAPGTTRTPPTASAKTTTSTTWTAWRASSRRMRHTCAQARDHRTRRCAQSGSICCGTSRYATRGEPRSACARVQPAEQLPASPGVSVHRRADAVHRRATSASTSSIRTATANCCC